MIYVSALLAGAAMLAPLPISRGERLLNVWTVRNGGIRFVRIGRLFFSFGISRDVRPLGGK